MSTFFSIVIPVHNAKKTIKRTLESVINQTFKDYEIVIVDDCSDDSTIEQVQSILENTDASYKIVKLKVNSCLAYARNLGVKLSIGEYVAFLDDDDLWLPNKLEVQHDAIQKHHLDWCFSNYNVMDASYNIRYSRKSEDKYYNFNDFMEGGNPVGVLTVIINRHILLKHVFKDVLNEDYYLWLDLSKEGYYAYLIKDILAQYMARPNSMSSNKLKSVVVMYNIVSLYSINKYYMPIYMFRYGFKGIISRIKSRNQL